MLGGWHQSFRVEIPSAELPVKRGAEKIWHQYIKELEDVIRSTAPAILPHLADSMRVIYGILAEMKDEIHAALKRLSECSSGVHPEFLWSLRQQLEPIFKAALEIRGSPHSQIPPLSHTTSHQLTVMNLVGKDQFKKRRASLVETVRDQSKVMFVAGCKKMRKKYLKNLAKLPKAFEKTASSAVSRQLPSSRCS
jgi:hypothetical protein